MTDLSALIERLEKVTGPDEALDADILKIANPSQWKYCDDLRQQKLAEAKRNNLPDREEACWRYAFGGMCRYTGSIDAALTLVPEIAEWQAGSVKLLGTYWAVVITTNKEHKVKGAINPAIALCIAALRARAKQS